MEVLFDRSRRDIELSSHIDRGTSPVNCLRLPIEDR